MGDVLLECMQSGINQGAKIYVMDLLCIFPLQSFFLVCISGFFFPPEEKEFLVKWSF